MHFAFDRYRRWAGAISARQTGSLVAWERGGTATAHALEGGAEERGGVLFIGPGTEVYEGMIVGEHNRAGGDLEINVARKKNR